MLSTRLLAVVTLCWCGLAVADEEDITEKTPQFTPPPRPTGDVYFVESFSDAAAFEKRWVKSGATKDGVDVDIAKYSGKWELQELGTDGALSGDVGLVMTEAAQHYAIAAKLDRPFVFDKDKVTAFVAQYEVNFQDGLSCGGAYMKLLSDTEDLDLENFQDKTPYSIMFGPDKCGLSSKVHFIVRFKNPVTGEIEEKHSKQSTEKMDFFDDKKTHLFTLVIRQDGVYHVMVDQELFISGKLLEDLSPPIVPDEMIDDPEDEKPESWDEREKIPEPGAVKPDDWDEDAPAKIPDPSASKPAEWLDEGPEYVEDPDAVMPEDWDEEEDGEWEAPMIPNPVCEEVGCGEWAPPMIANPDYKGKWKAPMIDNPDYDGKWSPRKIPNPAYFKTDAPFFDLTSIAAVGLELWTMSSKVFFDNFIVTGEVAVANNYARAGWTLKYEAERAYSGESSLGPWIDSFADMANEYPYLWVLYAFAIVSPFVVCAAFCVKTKGKPKEDDAAIRKKTDKPTPDDPAPSKSEGETQGSFVASAEEEEEERGEKGGEEEGVKEGEGGEAEEEKMEENEDEWEEEEKDEGQGEEEGKQGEEEEEEEEEASPDEPEQVEEIAAATSKGKSGGTRKRTRRED